jgi:glutamate 5-kinase
MITKVGTNMTLLSEALGRAKTIIIKVGSALLTDASCGEIKQEWLDALASDVAGLISQGKRIVIVSSGAVALGRKDLGIALDTPPAQIPLAQKQASSAVGQYYAFNGYHQALGAQDVKAAQVLLTIGETENRRNYLNARETLWTLMDKGIVPVINENDAVSTGELRFGDNDRLAVRVAHMVYADLVLLMSTVDGLYTANPDDDTDAAHIPVVDKITDKHVDMAGEAKPGLSTGGMKSKMEAALSATQSGVDLIIFDGRKSHALNDLEQARSTLFQAQRNSSESARKTWIKAHLNPKGALSVDDGALQALKNGKSLLPIGMTQVEGEFNRGDVVSVLSPVGVVIGRGMSAFSSENARKIIGRQSHEVAGILGYLGRAEIIHRNDLVLKL